MSYLDSEFVQLGIALAEKWNIARIDDAVCEAETELSEDVYVEFSRDYPDGSSYYIDYCDTEFRDGQDEAEKKFYGWIAETIRYDTNISDRLMKLAERIPDEELCTEYADVYFDKERIFDRAIESKRSEEGGDYYD